MKTIALCGSPRKGNTEFYLKTVLDIIEKSGCDTELVPLRDKTIDQCAGCYKCKNGEGCSIQDDFQEIFDLMVQADCILAGSPVYNGSITPKLKALLDRAGFSSRWMSNKLETNAGGYDWGQMVFSRKLFVPITVARKTGQTFAWSQLALWAGVNDLIIVGSNYWTVGTAGAGGQFNAEEDAEGLSIMKHVAENIDFLLKKIHV